MKTIIYSIVFAITCTLFIAGCGQTAPGGADPTVKETVIRIARQEYQRCISRMIYIRLARMQPNYDLTYDKLKLNSSSDANAKKAVAAIDAVMAKTNMALTNIRTDRIDEKIKKSYSSADLIVNNDKLPITYTAQRNAEGKVYVEVYGLKF